jgi:hypothetical protein
MRDYSLLVVNMCYVDKRLFEEVCSGKMSMRHGKLVQILKPITDSIRYTDREQRLIKLEETHAQLENGSRGPVRI